VQATQKKFEAMPHVEKRGEFIAGPENDIAEL
jgi:hypothetical protein